MSAFSVTLVCERHGEKLCGRIDPDIGREELTIIVQMCPKCKHDARLAGYEEASVNLIPDRHEMGG